MKKVINGLLYNTDTAKEIGYNLHSYKGDNNYYCETLFKKKTGEYFLHCEGGATSKYSTIICRSAVGTEVISPLKYAEAKDFAEKFLEADVYQEEFGEVSEGEKGTTALNIRLDTAIYNRIKREAQMQTTTIRAIIEDKFGFTALQEAAETDENF